MKAIIIISCIYIYNKVDTSMIYHMVRGQAIIKLYVFYNMLEVCDRLASGFGQDALDALFWTATDPHIRKRNTIEVLFHFLLVVAYVCIHTGMIMCQITVLNVAFNSHNKALLTIMMSNNFVEIKGNLFKRVDKSILFQISCSDVKERFHYYFLLTCVFMQNMTEFNWDSDHILVILPDAVLVLIAEYIVDWVKHAFIAKFNEIPPEAYAELSIALARDMVNSRQKHAFMDHSDLLSRRIGFTPIPLAVILIKVCMKSFKIHDWIGMACLAVFWMCLTSLKVLSSIVLLGIAAQILPKEDEAIVEDGTQLDSQVYSHKKSKPAETVETPTTRTSENHSDEDAAEATPTATKFPSDTSAQWNTLPRPGNSSPLHTSTPTSHVYVSSAHIHISSMAPSQTSSSLDDPELLLTSMTVPTLSQPSIIIQGGGTFDLEMPARDESSMQIENSEQADTSPPVKGKFPDPARKAEEGERGTDRGVSALGEDSVVQEEPAADCERQIPVSRETASADSLQTPSFIPFSHSKDGMDAVGDSDVSATEGITGGSAMQ